MEAYNITDISHIYVFFVNSLLEESEKVVQHMCDDI